MMISKQQAVGILKDIIKECRRIGDFFGLTTPRSLFRASCIKGLP